jgi:ketosteroid isomerase-like protein
VDEPEHGDGGKMGEEGESVAIVRTAYEAYVRGDLATMLGFVAEDLEWTYLDPSEADPEPQVCHGRAELERALTRLAHDGLTAELEEVTGLDDDVIVGFHTQGIDEHRARQADDRTYLVATVQGGRIIALRACRSRDEARTLAGIGDA